VRDILSGAAADDNLPRGVQLPTTAMLEGESSDHEHAEVEKGLTLGDEDSTAALAEYALAAVVSDAEALEPRTLKEVRARPDWPLWEKAIEEELETLRVAGTWVLEDAPPGANIVGSKWVFKAKKDASGSVVRYKARLVAQGYSQVPGVDYFDTYAPVAKLSSIRTVLAIANRHQMELHQVDIKGTYLNGDLTDAEVIYMKPPPGYAPKDLGARVLRLRRTLYGLKQSGRRWYQKLCEIMMKGMGYARCNVDMSVFYWQRGKDLVIMLVNVDDCSIAATSIRLISDLKRGIAKHVEITDLGELHWLLGIEIRIYPHGCKHPFDIRPISIDHE